jgi:cell division protein FtsL
MWERSGNRSGPVRVPEVHREQRYIFGGEPSPAVSGYAVRQNRRSVRRTFSTFNIIVALFALGLLIVLYIDNIIVVNQLVVDVNTLQRKYQRQIDSNATLQADVHRQSSLQRIGDIATGQLGMQYPHEQAQTIPQNPDLEERTKQVHRELGE